MRKPLKKNQILGKQFPIHEDSKPVVFSLKALFQPDSEFSFTVTNKTTQGIESGIENEILLPSSLLAPFQVL